MIDGRPKSEHEPDRAELQYFYLHMPLPRSLLHQGTTLRFAASCGFLGADKRPRVAGGLVTLPGVMA